MQFLIRKRILLLSLLAVIVGSVSLSVFLINSYVVNFIELGSIKSRLIQSVKSQTGLTMNVQGVNYSLLKGVVFTGVKINAPERKSGTAHLLQTENLILEISLIRVFQKKNPFDRLLIPSGKIDPWALTAEEWGSFFAAFSRAGKTGNNPRSLGNSTKHHTAGGAPSPVTKSKSDGGTVTAGLPTPEMRADRDLPREITISAANMRILVPEKYILSSGDRALINNLTVGLQVEPGLGEYQMNVYQKGEEEKSPRLRIRGKWKQESTRRMDFHFENLPLRFIIRFFQETSLFPPELKFLLKNAEIESGILRGRGSMDALTAGGWGMNIDGDYEKCSLRIGKEGGAFARMKNGQGKLNYNSVYINFPQGPNYARLKVEQNNFNVSFEYNKHRMKKKNLHNLELKAGGLLRDSSGSEGTDNLLTLGFPGVRTRGRFELFLKYSYASHWIKPELRFLLTDFDLIPSRSIFNFPADVTSGKDGKTGKQLPDIHFNSFSAIQKGESNLILNGKGSFATAPFQIHGQSESSIQLNPRRKNLDFSMKQNLTGEMTVQSLPYRYLVLPVYNMHSLLLRRGSARDAASAEDNGIIYRYRYVSPEIEQAFLTYSRIDWKFRFDKMEQTGGILPRSLTLSLYKKDDYFQVSLPETSTPNALLSMKYQLFLQRPLPAHKIELVARIKKNTLPLPEITGGNAPPREISLEYSMNGNGWLPHDIVYRTYSRLDLEVTDVNLGRLAPTHILGLKLGLAAEKFQADRFKLIRITSGRDFQYPYIYFYSDTMNASGNGRFQPDAGGLIKLDYDVKTKGRGDIKLKISKDGEWMPVAG